jgi:hypothetical protein
MSSIAVGLGIHLQAGAHERTHTITFEVKESGAPGVLAQSLGISGRLSPTYRHHSHRPSSEIEMANEPAPDSSNNSLAATPASSVDGNEQTSAPERLDIEDQTEHNNGQQRETEQAAEWFKSHEPDTMPNELFNPSYSGSLP